MPRTDRGSKLRSRWAPLAALAAVAMAGACSTTGASPGPPPTLLAAAGPYRVVAVVDVDTIELDRGSAGATTSARLVGLGGADPPGAPRCFGAEAIAGARRLLDGQKVRIVADPGWPIRDDEGRLSVYVWLDSGRMANHVLVEDGFAREAAAAPPCAYREAFAAAGERARRDGRGLWSPHTCAGATTRRAR